MILRNKKGELAALRRGGRAYSVVYMGAKLVWEAIRSCFGSGYWADDKPWLDDEPWKE